ncbi:MAG: signal peptidase II [Clostridiales bacterium]|nr:signal peptidase II [Clostridiales bacterium]
MLYTILTVLAAGLDQLCKTWVEEQRQETFPRAMERTKGKITLYRNHNSGFPFGFMKEYGQAVRMVPLMTVSMLTGIFLFLSGKKGWRLHKTALALLLGGAASNLYDRWVRRYVVDYFSIQAGFLKKVVFNLGDMFVFLGSALFMIAEFVDDRSAHDSADDSARRAAGEHSGGLLHACRSGRAATQQP